MLRKRKNKPFDERPPLREQKKRKERRSAALCRGGRPALFFTYIEAFGHYRFFMNRLRPFSGSSGLWLRLLCCGTTPSPRMRTQVASSGRS